MFVGVMMCVGLIIELLCVRFGIVNCFDFYLLDDFCSIFLCFVGIFDVDIDDDVVVELLCCSCGILCIVN